eukprot:3302604-Prymnesium_polylepis.2
MTITIDVAERGASARRDVVQIDEYGAEPLWEAPQSRLLECRIKRCRRFAWRPGSHGLPASELPFLKDHRCVHVGREELTLAVARQLCRIHVIHRDVRQHGDALTHHRRVLWRQNDGG